MGENVKGANKRQDDQTRTDDQATGQPGDKAPDDDARRHDSTGQQTTGRQDDRRRQQDRTGRQTITMTAGRQDGRTTGRQDDRRRRSIVARDDGRGTTTHGRVGLIYTPPKSHTHI